MVAPRKYLMTRWQNGYAGCARTAPYAGSIPVLVSPKRRLSGRLFLIGLYNFNGVRQDSLNVYVVLSHQPKHYQ